MGVGVNNKKVANTESSIQTRKIGNEQGKALIKCNAMGQNQNEFPIEHNPQGKYPMVYALNLSEEQFYLR